MASFKWWSGLNPVDGLIDMLISSDKVPEPEPFKVDDEAVGANIPVLFGTRVIKPKLAWYGDINLNRYKVSGSGKK